MPTSSLTNNSLKFNNTSINEINGKLDILPTGFVYIQLPGYKAPDEMFAGIWTDITSSFAGLFFRCEGGDALAFNGGVQEEGLPNITGQAGYDQGCGIVSPSTPFLTGCFKTGDSKSWALDGGRNSGKYIAFDASGSNSIYGNSEHVTPRNISIRLWVRES